MPVIILGKDAPPLADQLGDRLDPQDAGQLQALADAITLLKAWQILPPTSASIARRKLVTLIRAQVKATAA